MENNLSDQRHQSDVFARIISTVFSGKILLSRVILKLLNYHVKKSGHFVLNSCTGFDPAQGYLCSLKLPLTTSLMRSRSQVQIPGNEAETKNKQP